MTHTDFAELNGTKFYYERAGAGQPLVLLHAGICDTRMWDAQFGVLAQQYEVVRYDRRGFGQTAMVAGPYAHHHDLQALLQCLAIPRPVLVGCSQGARISLDFALEHPAQVAALVLVAPAISGFSFDGPPPPQAEALDRAEAAGDWETVNELELQVWVDGPQRTPAQVDAAVRAQVRAMNRLALQTPLDLGEETPLDPPAVQRLQEVRVPTLVITGTLDTPKTLAAAELLARNIPNAQTVRMPGTAHLPNMEQPAMFNRQVLEFLGRQRD